MRRKYHHGRADTRRDDGCQYEPVQAIAQALDKLEKKPVWTFQSTSMRPAAVFSRHFAIPTSYGIFACRESSQSTPPGTSSALLRSVWDGWFGATTRTCRKS